MRTLTTRPSLKRGWCPTLAAPMQSGDGLLVRVQAPAARLTPAQAHALAHAATQSGNGIIELTQRGNLQIRGLHANTLAAFAAAMAEAGLESPTHLLPAPLLGDDPGIDPATTALTARLTHAFATHPALAALPAKLTIAIEPGGILASRPVAADLVAHPDGRLAPPPAGRAAPPVGLLPYHGGAAFGLAPPFGQLDATMLAGLARLAAAHGTAIRVTAWRTLLLGRVAGPVDAGPAWITDPADPRLLITACIGAPGCARGTTPTRQDALRLRPTRPTHVSGCEKGCAHPGPSPVTYVAIAGRYHRIENGRAHDEPSPGGKGAGADLCTNTPP